MKDNNGNPTGTQLTITNADSSDDGDYKCTSANTHGEITRFVHVTVTKSSSKRSAVLETSKWLSLMRFIKIQSTLSDISCLYLSDEINTDGMFITFTEIAMDDSVLRAQGNKKTTLMWRINYN